MTSYSKNSLALYNKLTADESIIKSIEDYIEYIITYKNRFDYKNVPQLVLIVMSLIVNDKENNLNHDGELQELLDLFQNYFIIRLTNNNILNFDINEFKKKYEICTRLAILRINYSKKNGLCCIK